MTTKKHKVLFFDFVTHYGGAQRSTVYLMQQLSRSFDVHVLDPYGVCQDYLAAMEHCHVPATVMPCQLASFYIGGSNSIQRIAFLLKQLPDWMRLNSELKRQVDHIRPDVIVTNSYKAMALLWLSGVMKTVPVAYYARGWYQKTQVPWLGRWLIKQARFVMAISNAAADALSQWPIPRDRIHVCHTVIDFESVIHEVGQTQKSTTQQPHSKFKVLLPAQLLAAKGQQVAVEAARILKQEGIAFEMWLAGDVKMGVENTFIEGLKQSIQSYDLEEEVKLLGHRSDVRTLMTQADVVILPSRTEGFPRSIWEAMILRCPVIATPAGGILDLVIDGQTGLLIPMDDAESLANGMMQLIEHPDLAKELTENAYRYVTTTYSQDKTLSRIEETLLTACAR